MRESLSNVLNAEVNYYTRAKFIRKLHKAIIDKKSKPSAFPKLSRIGLTLIPLEALVITLEEDV